MRTGIVLLDWFCRERIDDDITKLWEPSVDPFIRCNIWHVKGRDRDVLVDSGLGLVSIREAAKDLFEKSLTAVATHTHYDHIGGMHEFEERLVHSREAAYLANPRAQPLPASLYADRLGEDVKQYAAEVGYALEGMLISRLPSDGYDVEAFEIRAAPATRIVEEGDLIDLGNRHFEILHLPGHSPGGIGLWEDRTGTLFSGDAIYDGPPLATLPEADIDDYVRTMYRLREMPIRVVHGGHEPSFGRDRLLQIIDAFLRQHRS